MRKRPCKRTRTKNLRKWSEIFSRVFKPIFLRKGRPFFRKFFSQKLSHWPSTFFGYPQPLGVCAIIPGDCDHSNGTAEPARWRHKPLHCQRRRFRFDAIPAHCILCWHIEIAQFRNFEMKNGLCFVFFVLRLCGTIFGFGRFPLKPQFYSFSWFTLFWAQKLFWPKQIVCTKMRLFSPFLTQIVSGNF